LLVKNKEEPILMSEQTLKVVIPMAGLGTRLRPQTWSKPKQLISVAGKTVLDHVLASLSTLPDPEDIELISIVGYLGDQIEQHIRNSYPRLKTHFVIQENPHGQSHALKLAAHLLTGPMLIVFADTLIETDLSFLENETADAVVWVKKVEDPRRFGVAEVGSNGWVVRLIEKPSDISNNLAVVGFYYFRHAEDLLAAIDEQIRLGLQLNGEYFLVDAVNLMLQKNLRMRTCKVETWLDAGTPEALLETNRYLLQNGLDNSLEAKKREGIVIYPPVYIHPSARVEGSVIGPYVSLGAGCKVMNSIIRNSILEDEAETTDVILESSLIGRRARLNRRASVINAGDNTEVSL
jgi:glucose-1-phosphate thymidylyltransferase